MSKVNPQCPICGEELEVREVAPCDDCGWDPTEIEHFNNHEHTYSEFEVYGSKLILCNYCDVDFSSYDPEVWGLPPKSKVGYGTVGFRKLAEIPNNKLSIAKGLFCPGCKAKLPMLQARIKANDANAT